MKKYFYEDLTDDERAELLKRPAIDLEKVFEIVKPILKDVKENGLAAVKKYSEKFDGYTGTEILVTEEEINTAEENLPNEVKDAIKNAYNNIEKFHKAEFPEKFTVETMPGVNCSREFRAIEKVGLYIPGGSSVLPSTVLMLGIPAKIAGCKRIVLCSPSKNNRLNYPLLYAAKLCGINEIYKTGGAQAIALMAYGTESINKVDKIFGPGNQFVTAAKLLVSIQHEGCSIDMPAGPSEVLVIADKNADASFAAADLLSQAEHGADSQVILATNSEALADKIVR